MLAINFSEQTSNSKARTVGCILKQAFSEPMPAAWPHKHQININIHLLSKPNASFVQPSKHAQKSPTRFPTSPSKAKEAIDRRAPQNFPGDAARGADQRDKGDNWELAAGFFL